MKTSLVYGGKCIELLANYNQESHCWRMLQMCFQWADPMLLDRLPKSGMTANGQLYRLDNSVLPTSENDGLVLPTPTVNESHNNPGFPSQWERHDSLNVEAAKMEGYTVETIGKNFRLNPRFVEEMMGFPIGWTELQP